MGEMNEAAYNAGRVIGCVISGLFSLYFLVRAFKSPSRSGFFANLALTFGLLVFCAPERFLDRDAFEYRSTFRILGIVRLLFGVAGLVFGYLAFLHLDRNQGKSWVRPLLGIGFSLLHFMVGRNYLSYTQECYLPPITGVKEGKLIPWVYEVPEPGFRLTLPSEDWEQEEFKDHPHSFVHSFPEMRCLIGNIIDCPDFTVNKEATKAFFSQEAFSDSPWTIREGVNDKGHPYCLFTSIQKKDTQEIYQAAILVFLENKQTEIYLHFEGLLQAKTQVTQSLERKVFEESVEFILRHIE